jgi:hypothetical protein
MDSIKNLLVKSKGFLTVPANLLASLAIIATVIVPAVDKYLKADEALQAKLTMLTEATNTVIARVLLLGTVPQVPQRCFPGYLTAAL